MNISVTLNDLLPVSYSYHETTQAQVQQKRIHKFQILIEKKANAKHT